MIIIMRKIKFMMRILITIIYKDIGMFENCDLRKKMLKEFYYFDCACGRCKTGLLFFLLYH